MNKIIIILLIFSITQVSCSSKKESKFVKPHLTISQFNDTTFVSQNVLNIETYAGRYFFADSYAGRIYCLDSSLNLNGTIGRKGRGPGEFVSPGNLYINSTGMYVGDAGQIKQFVKENNAWRLTTQFKYPPSAGLNETNAFIIRDSAIYVASAIEKWINKYTVFDNTKLHAFGDFLDWEPRIERNFVQILEFRNSLYVIGVSEPFIYRYDYNGALISHKDLWEDDFFNDSNLAQTHFYQEYKANSLRTVFRDAAIIDDKIYILFYDNEGENVVNKVIVIDPETYDIVEIFQLDRKEYYTCLSPSLTSRKGFITFNAETASLELYDIE